MALSGFPALKVFCYNQIIQEIYIQVSLLLNKQKTLHVKNSLSLVLSIIFTLGKFLIIQIKVYKLELCNKT